MSQANPWILAIRPKTLTASAGPVLLGGALAYFLNGSFDVLIFLITLLCSLLLQVSTNLVNDFFDGVRGTDTEHRLGPTRVTQTGMISADKVKNGFILTFSLSLLAGIYLMYNGGLPIVIIGLLSIIFAYVYTGGPLPLSHYGLGEVLAFVFFGPVAVWGTYYLQTHSHSNLVILAGAGPGFISAALMAINNLRDQHNDKHAGKHTIAVLVGEASSRLVPLVFIVLSMAVPVVFYTIMRTPVLIPVVGLTPFLFIGDWQRIYKAPIDSELNNSLAATGKYLFIYCLLFSLILINPFL